MAANTAGDSVAMAPAKLADDFAAWWSGVPWIWKSGKVEKAKSVAETVSPEKKRSDMLQKMTPRQNSPHSPLKPASQSSISVTPSPPHILTITQEDGQPLYTVAPYFQVRKSPKGGYGAFALQDIPPYTGILSEHALLQATNINILDQFENLSALEKESFVRLASFDELDSNKIVAIFKTNRFQVCGGVCGIFLIASRFNHACTPLCAYRYNMETEKLVLTTKAKDILKGQEITISYGQTGDELFWNWGFNCDCEKCFSAGMAGRW